MNQVIHAAGQVYQHPLDRALYLPCRMPASNISHDRLPATLPDGHPRAGWPHVWIAIPFYAMYLVALAGNTTLILVIVTDSALHVPMYLFLGLLSLT